MLRAYRDETNGVAFCRGATLVAAAKLFGHKLMIRDTPQKNTLCNLSLSFTRVENS